MNHDNAIKRKIVLGITGGIAAYKAAMLVRLLVKHQIDVQVVMTKAACEFITPLTLQALSGNPVHADMWNDQVGNGMPHIELSRGVDAILVAPASADFIAKIVHGHADDLLSTLCLARDCPLLMAPAMNKQMWENPATQRNIQQAKLDEIVIFGPDAGDQACGEVGLGRMLEPEALLSLIYAYFTPKILTQQKILITAGATMEMIDPVRGITNLSSGKMGFALAQVASNMGADVTLIAGIHHLPTPINVKVINVTSAEEMYKAVMQAIPTQTVFISVAAVADYSPAQVSDQKIKKNDQNMTLSLTRNRDILGEVAQLDNPPFCVGFAAETERLIEYASKKRLAKKIPLIVANLMSESMGKNDAKVTLIDDEGAYQLSTADKMTIAADILTFIEKKLT